MKRSDLISKLELAAPALSNNDIVPVMTHFWFTGDAVVAYNGHVGISVPLKTEFEGAVPGSAMLNLVKAAGSKEIDLEYSGKELTIKAGGSRMKLATLGADHFSSLFNMPAAPKEVMEVNAAKFNACIDTCMRSVSMDTSVPDYLGVTMIPADKQCTFYSSSGVTMSRATLQTKSGALFEGRAILPSLFCKQLLQVHDDKHLRLAIKNKYAIYANESGVRLYGQLVESQKPLPFAKVFERHHPAKDDDKLVPIASKLVRILERACIMAAGDAKAVRTMITVKSNVATFVTTSALGEVRDTMQLNDHPDAQLTVDPKAVRSGCGDFDRMLISGSFVMANDSAYYMVSGREV